MPRPSPSGSEVKLAQNAKPEPVLELAAIELLLEGEELVEGDELAGTLELELAGAIDDAELATTTGGVVLLLPPPPPQLTKKTDTTQKLNSLNGCIIFSLIVLIGLN